jgi:hypothetical protein
MLDLLQCIASPNRFLNRLNALWSSLSSRSLLNDLHGDPTKLAWSWESPFCFYSSRLLLIRYKNISEDTNQATFIPSGAGRIFFINGIY